MSRNGPNRPTAGCDGCVDVVFLLLLFRHVFLLCIQSSVFLFVCLFPSFLYLIWIYFIGRRFGAFLCTFISMSRHLCDVCSGPEKPRIDLVSSSCVNVLLRSLALWAFTCILTARSSNCRQHGVSMATVCVPLALSSLLSATGPP